MKLITLLSLCIVLSCITPCVSAYDAEIETLAGEKIITPQYQDNVSNFLLYNGGHVVYSVYMHHHVMGLQDSYIGTIEQGHGIILDNNASYTVYAGYDVVRDYSDPDVILEKVFSWWTVILYLLIIIIVIYGVYKIIKGR